MTLNSKTGAVGAYLPSVLSMVPNFWSSKAGKTSEKSEKDDSKTLSNGREVSQQPPEGSSAVVNLVKPFILWPNNRMVVTKLSEKAYKRVINSSETKGKVKAEKTKEKNDEKDSFVKWVGRTSGNALGNKCGEGMLYAVTAPLMAFTLGPVAATFATPALVETIKTFGGITAIANNLGNLGEIVLPVATNKCAMLYDKVLNSHKSLEKSSDNRSPDDSLLSKVITFKDGKYSIGSEEIDEEVDFEEELEDITFYQICQQILHSDQAEDLFKTYVRSRDDGKLVLADGHICSKKEAEVLSQAGRLLRGKKGNKDKVKKAILLLAKHYNPEIKRKFFYELYKLADDEIFRKSVRNNFMIEMSDGTFGFEDDKGKISLISKEEAEIMRAETEEYVNYYVENYATEGMKEFVVLDNSEETTTKNSEGFLASTFNRFTTGWLKA